jgi:hypothetical protein
VPGTCLAPFSLAVKNARTGVYINRAAAGKTMAAHISPVAWRKINEKNTTGNNFVMCSRDCIWAGSHRIEQGNQRFDAVSGGTAGTGNKGRHIELQRLPGGSKLRY